MLLFRTVVIFYLFFTCQTENEPEPVAIRVSQSVCLSVSHQTDSERAPLAASVLTWLKEGGSKSGLVLGFRLDCSDYHFDN